MADLGFTAEGLKSAFETDAQGAIISVLEALEKLPPAARTTASLTIFGQNYGDEVAKLTGGLENYRKALGLIQDPTKLAGSVTEEFQIRRAPAGWGRSCRSPKTR